MGSEHLTPTSRIMMYKGEILRMNYIHRLHRNYCTHVYKYHTTDKYPLFITQHNTCSHFAGTRLGQCISHEISNIHLESMCWVLSLPTSALGRLVRITRRQHHWHLSLGWCPVGYTYCEEVGQQSDCRRRRQQHHCAHCHVHLCKSSKKKMIMSGICISLATIHRNISIIFNCVPLTCRMSVARTHRAPLIWVVSPQRSSLVSTGTTHSTITSS